MGLRNLLRTTVGTVVDACTRNPELRARVKADPKAALAEEGMDLPFDEARVVEDTPETTHVALTDPNAELSDEQMETVVGGTGMSARDYIAHADRMDDLRRRAGMGNFGFRD